jgi:hypothetical protein
MNVTAPATVARERRFIVFTPAPLHLIAPHPVKRKVSWKDDIVPAGHPQPATARTVNVHFVRRIAIYFSENTDMAKVIGAI